MRKALLIILSALFYTTIVSAQSDFKLQPNGSFLSPDNKQYMVFEYPELSQQQLYEKFLVSISACYVSPKDVISSVTNEGISVNGHEDYFVSIKAMGQRLYLDARYVIKLYFKDGRVRVDAPIVSSLGPYHVDFGEWLYSQKIYKDGVPNPKKQQSIDDCNTFFKKLIDRFLKFEHEVQEDW